MWINRRRKKVLFIQQLLQADVERQRVVGQGIAEGPNDGPIVDYESGDTMPATQFETGRLRVVRADEDHLPGQFSFFAGIYDCPQVCTGARNQCTNFDDVRHRRPPILCPFRKGIFRSRPAFSLFAILDHAKA